MAVSPMTLARVATPWSIADVAILSGISESNLSRLWDDPRWLDRIKGKSLQALIGAIPRVDEYVRLFSLAERRSSLFEALAARGVAVDREAFKRLVVDDDIPEQYLSNALSVALPILDGDADRTAGLLVRFWGREQDSALGHVLGTEPGRDGLLSDPMPLLAAAAEMVQMLGDKANSFHAVVGQANLGHHIARSIDLANIDDVLSAKRRSALVARSVVMGQIMATNDVDAARDYSARLVRENFLAVVEEWAFPTYTHDAQVTRDFSLPRGLVLRNTAAEILREIAEYNDAYFFYLVTTCIPTVLARDSSFGGRISDLRMALHKRIETCGEASSRAAGAKLLREIEPTSESPSKERYSSYDW